MVLRRFAFAVGLLVALLASQVPEFTQQYRQRLGGALDELGAMVTAFDGEASAQFLTREQGIARLKSNPDVLAQQRGTSLEDAAARRDRLAQQQAAFADAGPVWQYVVLAQGLDPGIARHAYADFSPAVPVTEAGFVGAGAGFVVGWLLTSVLTWPLRRSRRRRLDEPALR